MNFIRNKFLAINFIGIFSIAFLVLFLTFTESLFSARGLGFSLSFLLFSIVKLCTSWRTIALRYISLNYSLKMFEWVCVQSLSQVRLFASPWTVAHQAFLSMELSRQKYWSRLPFPTPGDLPNPGRYVVFNVFIYSVEFKNFSPSFMHWKK